MKIIPIHNRVRRPFELTSTQLRAVINNFWVNRRTITRAQVARIFRGTGEMQAITYQGMPHEPLQKEVYSAFAEPKRLRIGCQTFTGESFQAIKKWALRK